MSEHEPRITCGNTLLWHDGPVMSWAVLHQDGAESTGIIQDLPEEGPHHQLLAIFESDLRHLFLRDRLCLREIMAHPETRLWGVDYEGSTTRLTRYDEPVHADLLPDPGLTWSMLSGNDRARRAA